MNVLVIGGYGFIGSYVSEKFYKEGYNVFIIDNLKSGVQGNVTFEHRFIEMDAKDDRCADIFRINDLDVVVHCATQFDRSDTSEKGRDDGKADLLGLINTIGLSEQHGVGRFVFISSAEVYGEHNRPRVSEASQTNPGSLLGTSKLASELYCRKWHELLGLSTVSLRLTNVYGPRQHGRRGGGVVYEIMQRVQRGCDVASPDEKSAIRDYLFVEDAADAIYRCAESDICGVINLSSHATTSTSDLAKLIKQHLRRRGMACEPTAERRNRPAREGTSLLIDNSKLIREVGWSPRQSLDEGLKITCDWFLGTVESIDVEPQLTKNSRFVNFSLNLSDRLVSYSGSVLGLILTVLIGESLATGSEQAFMDLKILYVIVFGVAYGLKHAMIAVTLASFVYLLQITKYGSDMSLFINDADSLLYLAFYLFIGFAVGYSSEIKKRSVAAHEQDKIAAEEKLAYLGSIHTETLNIKDELQKQIKMSENSFGKLFSIIKELDSLEPERLVSAALIVIERVMRVNCVALHMVSDCGLYGRLIAGSSGLSSTSDYSVSVEQNAAFRAVMNSKDIYVNKGLIADLPVMMAPIFDNGRIVAMASIADLDFFNVNLNQQNLFKITSNLISTAFSRAYSYQQAINGRKSRRSTFVGDAEDFEKLLAIKMDAKELGIADYSVLHLRDASILKNDRLDIAREIRRVDYLCFGKNEIPYILLTNTGESGAIAVSERLMSRGIIATLSTEVDLVA